MSETSERLIAEVRERAVQMAHDQLRREGVATVEHRQVAAGVNAGLVCLAAVVQGGFQRAALDSTEAPEPCAPTTSAHPSGGPHHDP